MSGRAEPRSIAVDPFGIVPGLPVPGAAGESALEPSGIEGFFMRVR